VYKGRETRNGGLGVWRRVFMLLEVSDSKLLQSGVPEKEAQRANVELHGFGTIGAERSKSKWNSGSVRSQRRTVKGIM